MTDSEPGLPGPNGDNEAASGDRTVDVGHLGSARHSQRIDVVGLIAAIAAAVAAIVVLRVTNSRIFAAALLIVAGLALVVVWFAGANRLPWFRNCLVTVVVVALVGAGIYFVVFPDSRSHEKTQATAPTPASVASSDIKFLDPRNDALVKQCPKIDGTGVIPSGYGLWIIVVPNTNVESKEYWIESQAKADGPDHWSAINSISIGSPTTSGTNADIYAVLIDRRWSDYFAASSASGNFDANFLPPTPAGGIVGPISVARVSGAGFCH